MKLGEIMRFDVCTGTDWTGLLLNGFEGPWWDRNRDTLFTISDLWFLAGWLFHLPGDYLLRVFIANAPGLATFLELDCGVIGGLISGFVSFFAWFIVFILLALLFEFLSEALDRRGDA